MDMPVVLASACSAARPSRRNPCPTPRSAPLTQRDGVSAPHANPHCPPLIPPPTHPQNDKYLASSRPCAQTEHDIRAIVKAATADHEMRWSADTQLK